MKKIISVFFAATLVLSLLAVPASAKETVLPAQVEGSIFGGGNVALDVRFDPAWLTEAAPDEYSKDLAAFAGILSADSYFREKDVARGTPNRVLIDGESPEEYTRAALPEAFGFTDVRYIESFKEKEYETDPNDSVTLVLACLNDPDTDCFIAVIRGCFSAGEWYSIFDPGCAGEAYASYTGAHPEWTAADSMKGLDIAANRAMAFIRGYIAEHDDPERPNCLLITGHSRGGAIAEILGARFENDPGVRSCAYSFNSSAVTTDASAEQYATVFNIFDSGDLFCDLLPFAGEPFFRYGRTLSLSLREHGEITDEIARISGRNDYACVGPDAAAAYKALFGKMFPDRASLYAPLTVSLLFDTSEEAAAKRDELTALIDAGSGLGLEAFCLVAGPEEEAGGYGLTLQYCRAAWLQAMARTLAYGQTAADAAKALFAGLEDVAAMEDLIMANAAAISAGHRLLNSLILSQSF